MTPSMFYQAEIHRLRTKSQQANLPHSALFDALLPVIANTTAAIQQEVYENLIGQRRQQFQQTFPYLHAAVPNSLLAKLSANTLGHKPLTLAAGTKVEAVDNQNIHFHFETATTETFLPFEISAVVYREEEAKLHIQFQSAKPCYLEALPFSLWINAANNPAESLALFEQLAQARCCLTLADSHSNSDIELDCQPHQPLLAHPNLRNKTFLQYPLLFSCLSIHLPTITPSDQPIQTFSLAFDLESAPNITSDLSHAFQTNQCLLVNLFEDYAQSAELAYHKEYQPIQHAEHAEYTCYSLKTVALQHNGTLTPCLPHVIQFLPDEPSYDFLPAHSPKNNTRSRIRFHAVHQRQAQVQILAQWTQFQLADASALRLQFKAKERQRLQLEAVSYHPFQLSAEVHIDALLNCLSLAWKQLSLDTLQQLMRLLIHNSSPFYPISKQCIALKKGQTTTQQTQYQLHFSNVDPCDKALCYQLIKTLNSFLNNNISLVNPIHLQG